MSTSATTARPNSTSSAARSHRSWSTPVNGGDGGADIVTVNDLTGTDVEEFNLDLQAVSAVATAESTT